MRLSVVFCSVFLCCAVFAEAHTPQTAFAKKGFDSCNHCVYGRAEKQLAVGQTQPVTVGAVKLGPVGPIRGIRFDKSSSSFIVEHTGTYVIDYFLQAYSSTVYGLDSFMSIAIRVNGSLKGVRNLVPIDLRGIGGAYYSKNSVIFERLRKGDKVSLVVTKRVPSSIEFYNPTNPHETVPPDTVAYLVIRKIGKSG